MKKPIQAVQVLRKELARMEEKTQEVLEQMRALASAMKGERLERAREHGEELVKEHRVDITRGRFRTPKG